MKSRPGIHCTIDPAERPRMILRRKSRTNMTSGRVAMTQAAEISPHGMVYWPGNRAIPTGKV